MYSWNLGTCQGCAHPAHSDLRPPLACLSPIQITEPARFQCLISRSVRPTQVRKSDRDGCLQSIDHLRTLGLRECRTPIEMDGICSHCSIDDRLKTDTRQVVGPVRAVGKLVGRQWSKGRWFETRMDSDHILIPITINWFAGVSIMWPAAPNMLRCLWALSNN
jgi:hypothetical protein